MSNTYGFIFQIKICNTVAVLWGIQCEVWIKLHLYPSGEPHTIYEKIHSLRQWFERLTYQLTNFHLCFTLFLDSLFWFDETGTHTAGSNNIKCRDVNYPPGSFSPENCVWTVGVDLILLCFPLQCLAGVLVPYKLKVWGNPASSTSIGAIFPTVFAHFVSLSHILVFLKIFQTCSLLFMSHAELCPVISDVATMSHWRLSWWLAVFSNKVLFN